MPSSSTVMGTISAGEPATAVQSEAPPGFTTIDGGSGSPTRTVFVTKFVIITPARKMLVGVAQRKIFVVLPSAPLMA